MRYHYEKPSIYLSMYGTTYNCSHPIYNECTLFQIGEKGLAVIQQRFDPDTKATWWSWIDPWLTDDIYLHPGFKAFFDMKLVKVNRNEVLKERSLYKKSNNLLLLEQFIESGMGCAKVEGYTHNSPTSCAAALSRSIKNYNLHGIMCIQRKNNVYLIRIEDEKED